MEGAAPVAAGAPPFTPPPYNPLAVPVGGKRSLDASGPANPSLTEQQMSDAKRQQTAGRTPGKQGRGPETVYRLLASSRHAGFIIGKGGCEIKRIREQTGARLKVVETVSGCEERPVVISSRTGDSFDDCPAQAAVLLMYQKFKEAETQQPSGIPEVPLRMLVSQTQAGCLIGKSGVYIKQVRDETGANLRVLPDNDLPLCALANDRAVQMNGSSDVIEAALKVVIKKLWENPPREPPGGAPPVLLAALGQGGGGMEQQLQLQAQAIQPSIFQQQPLMGTPGGIQMVGAAPGQMFGGHMQQQHQHQQQQVIGGAGTPGRKTVMVPNNQVGLIIGTGGSNIVQMRQNSGAGIKVHQNASGDPNALRMIEVSGQPDQIAAAEAMLYAAGQRQPLPPGPAVSGPVPPVSAAPPPYGGVVAHQHPPPYGAPPPGGPPPLGGPPPPQHYQQQHWG